MTRRFANELKARLKCRSCSDAALADRHFCASHLAYARAQWHKHVTTRQKKGLCIGCHNKHLAGEQRCGRCKADNRSTCKSWYRNHRDQLRARYRQRIMNGLCGSCGKRARVRDHDKCLTCHGRRYAS